MNETYVERIVCPISIDNLQCIIRQARAEERGVSIAGGRHAMGGQQFGTGTILLDTSRLNRVLSFDRERGVIEVQAGCCWPELFEYLERGQQVGDTAWGIRQKQTGADRLSIGGALSANAHGRGLHFKPMVDDVESFRLVDGQGRIVSCSRSENQELFKLAIGGYGLFGVIVDVKLRLMRRCKVQRVVRLIDVQELVAAVEQKVAAGYLYGDFQFSIDPQSEDFLSKGVFSCYQPVDEKTPIRERQKELQMSEWVDLFYLAHTDKKTAFESYASYYLSTDGQIYWSDTHQLAEYLDNYHEALDERLPPESRGSEMIGELYVPRSALVRFMKDMREDMRASQADLIYGTIRFIEKDDETFLRWANERYACVVFNLHTGHAPDATERTAAQFRRLINRAIQYRGSCYLTYHRWATREQLVACYPQFVEFMKLKRKYDPEERFQSEWYRFHAKMFSSVLYP